MTEQTFREVTAIVGAAPCVTSAAERANLRIIAVVPAYNASAKLADVIRGLDGRVDCVVVIDDGSTDATPEIGRAEGAHVVSHSENCGLGCALRTGFDVARAEGADIVVTLDADGQHSPEDVGRIIARLVANHCDMVVGSRLTDRSQWHRFPPLRLIGNLVLTTLTNSAAGARVTTDSQSGYRAFSRAVLDAVDLRSTHMAISSEIILEVARSGFRIAEVPIEATYEDEISAQRFFKDPTFIMALVLTRWMRRLGQGTAAREQRLDTPADRV